MKSYNLYCFCVSVYNNCATFSWRLSLLMLHCRRRTKMCQSKWNVGLGTPRRCVNVRGIREWGMAAAVHAERGFEVPDISHPRSTMRRVKMPRSAAAAAT